MKGRTYIFAYLSALVIGILLLVFHDQPGLYEGVVIAMGALIIIPSAIMLISSLKPRKKSATGASSRTWYGLVASIAGLIFGIWMLCMPTFFINASIYTLGVVMILAGVAGIMFVINAARPAPVQFAWLIVPVLSVAAGLVIMFLGPQTVANCAGLVTGIVLIVYAVNGFTSSAREGRIARAVANEVAREQAVVAEHDKKEQ